MHDQNFSDRDYNFILKERKKFHDGKKISRSI